MEDVVATQQTTDLSEAWPEKEKSILNYCSWNHYKKMILEYPALFPSYKEAKDILGDLTRVMNIRNAITYHAHTVPTGAQEHLAVFISKLIKVLRKAAESEQ